MQRVAYRRSAPSRLIRTLLCAYVFATGSANIGPTRSGLSVEGECDTGGPGASACAIYNGNSRRVACAEQYFACCTLDPFGCSCVLNE